MSLLDGVVLNILQEKWNKFIKVRFYLELLFFIIFYGLTSTAMIMRRSYFDFLRDTSSILHIPPYKNQTLQISSNFTNLTTDKVSCINITTATAFLTDECACVYLYPIDPNGYVSKLNVLFSSVNFSFYKLYLGSLCN